MYDLNFLDVDGKIVHLVFDFEIKALQAVQVISYNGGSMIWSETFDIYNDALEDWARPENNPLAVESLYGE